MRRCSVPRLQPVTPTYLGRLACHFYIFFERSKKITTNALGDSILTKLKQIDNNLDRVDNVDIVDCIDIVVDVGDNFKHCRANMKQYQALFDEISKTSLTDWLSNIMDQKDAKKS